MLRVRGIKNSEFADKFYAVDFLIAERMSAFVSLNSKKWAQFIREKLKRTKGTPKKIQTKGAPRIKISCGRWEVWRDGKPTL